MIRIMVVDGESDIEPMFRQKFRNEIKAGAVDLLYEPQQVISAHYD